MKSRYTAKNNFGNRRTWGINPTSKIHNQKYKKYNRNTKQNKQWKKGD